MSILTEYLRTRPGSHRSRHPFSYVALGKHAQWITEEHPWQYNNGPGSPLAKLCSLSGAVLLLGSPIASVTLLHHAEHLANVPDKRIDKYRMPVLWNRQRVWLDFEEYDTTEGIVDWPDNYFDTIMRDYLFSGNGSAGRVGGAESYLFEAKPLTAFGVEWMETRFNGKGRQQCLPTAAEDGADQP